MNQLRSIHLSTTPRLTISALLRRGDLAAVTRTGLGAVLAPRPRRHPTLGGARARHRVTGHVHVSGRKVAFRPTGAIRLQLDDVNSRAATKAQKRSGMP